MDVHDSDHYLRARWMDPAAGRFVTQDTYLGNSGDPTSLHKYLYANADPTTYSDPSGFYSIGDFEEAQEGAAIVANAHYANAVRMVGAGVRTAPTRRLFKVLVAAAVTSGGAAILIETLVRDCVRSRRDCDFDTAILGHGSELQAHSWHILDSQMGQGSNELPTDQMLNASFAVRDDDWENIWYNLSPACGDGARLAFGGASTCDEYPFASTTQGGVTNYVLGRVSLRLVPRHEQNRQATLIRSFYVGAAISQDGKSEFSKFYSMANPTTPSFYITRQGLVRFPLSK